MATVFTHAAVGGALAALAPAGVPRWRAATALAGVSVLPDLDVVGFALGIPYGHALGHRGLSHSLPFALAVGLVLPFAVLPPALREWHRALGLACLAALACASHGVLDALTDGGRGIGFWLPFSAERHFWPWRPLPVSPLEPLEFFGARGRRILETEIRLVWLPWAAGIASVWLGLRARRRAA